MSRNTDIVILSKPFLAFLYRFIRAYARGLLREGYARSPLEVMACEHQRRFERDPVPYPAAALVREQLEARFRRGA